MPECALWPSGCSAALTHGHGAGGQTHEAQKTAGSSSSDSHVAMSPTPLKCIFFVPSSSNPSLTMTVELPHKESESLACWCLGYSAGLLPSQLPHPVQASAHTPPLPTDTAAASALLFQYLILLAFLTGSLLTQSPVLSAACPWPNLCSVLL